MRFEKCVSTALDRIYRTAALTPTPYYTSLPPQFAVNFLQLSLPRSRLPSSAKVRRVFNLPGRFQGVSLGLDGLPIRRVYCRCGPKMVRRFPKPPQLHQAGPKTEARHNILRIYSNGLAVILRGLSIVAAREVG